MSAGFDGAFSVAVREFYYSKEGRRLAALPNTSIQTFVCERCRRSHITATLHRTEILATFCRREDGSRTVPTGRCYPVLRLAHGGWKTHTTKRRINEILEELGGPQCARILYQRDYDWYLSDQVWIGGGAAETLIGEDSTGITPRAWVWWPDRYPINCEPGRALPTAPGSL